MPSEITVVFTSSVVMTDDDWNTAVARSVMDYAEIDIDVIEVTQEEV